MITIKNIQDNILSQGFTWVKIYDLDGDLIGQLSGNGKKPVTPQSILKYVKTFVADNPGIYNFEFKKFYNSANAIKYKKINCSGSSEVLMQVSFNHDEEREKIRQQLIQEEKDKRAKINYDQKVQELETMFGRSSWFIQRCLEHFNIIPPGVMGTLNGSPQNQNTINMQGEKPALPGTLSPEEQQKSNEALIKLLQVMSTDTLLAMANKLHSNPNLVQTLKSFL